MVTSRGITEPAPKVVLLDVLLLPPSGRELSFTDGRVGVTLNVAESVDVQNVLGTKLESVKDTKSIFSLVSVRVGQEQETIISTEIDFNSPLVRSCLIVPWHLDVLLIDWRTSFVEVGSKTSHKLCALPFVDDGNIVEHKDVFKAGLCVNGVSEVSHVASFHPLVFDLGKALLKLRL